MDLRAGTVPLLLVLLLLALPAQAMVGGGPSGPGDDGDPPQAEPVILWLKAGAFDPLTDPAPGPAWLHRGSTRPYYIVQFDGPVLPEWRDDVEALDVVLLQYLPENAFFARVPATSVDDVRHVDHVRYVGPIHPAYRVQPVLIDSLRSPAAERLDLLLWDAVTAGDVARLVEADGGRVLTVDVDLLTVDLRLSALPALLADASLGIRWAEPHLAPQPINDNDARTAKARQQSDGTYVSSGHALWAYDPSSDTFDGYTGENVTITVADTGLDTTHPAFTGRIVEYFDYGNDGEEDTDGHGTHVAGTALGDGSWRSSDVGQDGKYAGLAPGAGLVVQEVFVAGNPGANGMGRDAEGEGATISSNSWISGYFGDYNGQCEAYDRLTHDANNVKPGDQPIFYVFGAGNDGWGGEETIRPPSLAKNVLSVGSTGNDKWGASSSTISGFSSQGPVEDGRIKPDVVIPGQTVASTRSSYPTAHQGWSRPGDGQESYVYGSGTSMATPGAAGSAAVVTQFYRESMDAEPSPAMLKAILINGAQPLTGYEYPGNQQGWGRIDLERSLLQTETYKVHWFDQEVALDMEPGSESHSIWLLVKRGEDLKVTLTWSDVPGTVNSAKHLINDLDLELTDPDGNRYSGNNFTDGVSNALADFTPDRTNNVEGILVESPKEGLWNLNVRAYDIPSGTQSFALVVSGNVEPGHVDLMAGGLTPDVATAEEGHVVTISGNVANIGNRDAIGVDYRFEQVDPEGSVKVLDEADLGDLVPLQEVDLDWRVTGVRGTHTFRLVVDPGGGVLESDEENNVLELQYFFKGFDVSLKADQASFLARPGDLVTVEMGLDNLGNVPDEIHVSGTTPPPGWTAGLVKDDFTISPGETAKVVLDLMVPLNATAGERAFLVVTAASGGNASRTSALSVEVEVEQVFGLEVASMSPGQDMLPGEDRTFELLVRNTGNGEDVYTLTLPEPLPEGWFLQFPADVVRVPLRSQTVTRLVLTAPEPALAGTSILFSVGIASSGPSLEKNVSFSAQVVQFYDTEVEVLDLVSSGNAGETIVIPLSIRNRGNGPVTYNGDINFPGPAWKGGLDLANLTLDGYRDARSNLTFTVPVDALNASYDFTMLVISSGGEVHLTNFTFTVLQFHQLSVELVSEVPTVTQGQQAWVRLRLVNSGNGLEEVTLTADPPSTWTFDFSDRYPSIEPFSEVVVDVRLDTDLVSPGGSYEVLLAAYYGPAKMESQEVTVSVNVLTRPDLTVPEWGLVLSEVSPYVDSLVRITANVTNEGETTAREVFVQLFVDGVPVGQPQYVSSIEPGETETMTFLWTTNSSGPKEVRVVADYRDDVDEVDEDNNSASTTVQVSKVDLKTSPGPTLVVALLAVMAAVGLTWDHRRRRKGMLS